MPELTIAEFFSRYPTDEACIKEVFDRKYGQLKTCPKCKKSSPSFYKIRKKRCYKCGSCGGEIFPLAGTIMHGTNTPIKLWFFAIYLFSMSRRGLSANELSKHLGVTYKTAWRIGHKIRELMGTTGQFHLLGEVEIDESLFGGRAKGKRGWGAGNKTCLFGMVEKNGRVRTVIIHNRKAKTLIPIIEKNVKTGTHVYTDKFKVYRIIRFRGYKHSVKENGWNCTNTVEGYWGNLKKSILSTHTWISPKYLQNYLDEFDFRFNHRDKLKPEKSSFDELLDRL